MHICYLVTNVRDWHIRTFSIIWGNIQVCKKRRETSGGKCPTPLLQQYLRSDLTLLCQMSNWWRRDVFVLRHRSLRRIIWMFIACRRERLYHTDYGHFFIRRETSSCCTKRIHGDNDLGGDTIKDTKGLQVLLGNFHAVPKKLSCYSLPFGRSNLGDLQHLQVNAQQPLFLMAPYLRISPAISLSK